MCIRDSPRTAYAARHKEPLPKHLCRRCRHIQRQTVDRNLMLNMHADRTDLSIGNPHPNWLSTILCRHPEARRDGHRRTSQPVDVTDDTAPQPYHRVDHKLPRPVIGRLALSLIHI